MIRSIQRDSDGISMFRQIVAMAVVIGVLAGGFLLIYVQKSTPTQGPLRIEPGDLVIVGYIGTFYDNGRVFDTSYMRVAEDNVSYPKAVSFGWRPQWTNLSIEPVGAGKVIKGFDEGIVGLAVRESKRIIIPQDQGYGQQDPTKVFERPLLEQVPARVVMNETAFLDKYGTNAQDGLIVKDPFWGWNATVSLSNNIVTVVNSPFLGERIRPYRAWNAQVVGIDDGANGGTGVVSVQNDLRMEDGETILARDGTNQFIVSSVDTVREVYVANYNREVVGRTLVFDVTVESIKRV